MKIIKPIVDLYRDIGTSGYTIPSLISTTVDNVYSDWNASTTYSAGTTVVYGFLLYTAQLETTGDMPDDDNSVYWVAIGYTNKYAMFNGSTTSSTSQDGDDFVVEISADGVNALSLFRLRADTVNVTMTHPTLGEVYNTDYDTRLSTVTANIFDYYDYFFLPYPEEEETSTLTILDIPPYPTATITITLTRSGETAYLGLLTYGTVREVGTVDYGTSASINDYSSKETNDYGDTTIIERAYTDKAEYDLTLPRSQVSSFKRLLASLRATPILVVGSDDDEGTHVYGFIEDFEITYTDFETSDVTLTIEGL